MEKIQIEDYLPVVKQLSGAELSEHDQKTLTSLFRERHFKKIVPIPDGLSSFLKVLRMVQANALLDGSGQIVPEKELTVLRKQSPSHFPKALKPSEKGKRKYLVECTRGLIEYLNATGLTDNDSRHLAGRIIAIVYDDWYPLYKNGTTKGLGGERNFVLRRIKQLLGEVKKLA